MHACILLICLSGSYTVVVLGADEIRGSRLVARGYGVFILCSSIGLMSPGSTVITRNFIAAGFGPFEGMGFCVSVAEQKRQYIF